MGDNGRVGDRPGRLRIVPRKTRSTRDTTTDLPASKSAENSSIAFKFMEISDFLDLEAVVDNDVEEEEEEDPGDREFLDNFELSSPESPSLFSPNDSMQEASALEAVSREYNRRARVGSTEESSVFGLLVFAVRAQKTHESYVVAVLRERAGFDPPSVNRRTAWAAIASIEFKATAPGYVYIRAMTLAAAKSLLDNSPVMYVPRSCHPLLVDDVPTTSHSPQNLGHEGGWVRVAVGRYRGDVGIVAAAPANSDTVTIYVVPRLDLSRPVMDGTVFIDTGFPNRPPAVVIRNPRAIDHLYPGCISHYNPDTASFTAAREYEFVDGLLKLRVDRSAVQINPTLPSAADLEAFCDSPHIDISQALRSIELYHLRRHLRQHDRIHVLQGSLLDMLGLVDSVREESVHFRPLETEGTLYATAIGDVCRAFQPGDHIEVSGTVIRRGIVGAIGLKWVYYVEEGTHNARSAPRAFCSPYVPDFRALTNAQVRSARSRAPLPRPPPKNPLVHKHVVILAKGNWKGYTGYVQSVNDESDLAEVALDAQPGRIVQVSRYRLSDVDSPSMLQTVDRAHDGPSSIQDPAYPDSPYARPSSPRQDNPFSIWDLGTPPRIPFPTDWNLMPEAEYGGSTPMPPRIVDQTSDCLPDSLPPDDNFGAADTYDLALLQTEGPGAWLLSQAIQQELRSLRVCLKIRDPRHKVYDGMYDRHIGHSLTPGDTAIHLDRHQIALRLRNINGGHTDIAVPVHLTEPVGVGKGYQPGGIVMRGPKEGTRVVVVCAVGSTGMYRVARWQSESERFTVPSGDICRVQRPF
ncbi:hypothetical protein BV25DRAFT_1836610 [Artomyces pyxidatus]|uniref:Uncharacterized protein n=1 Tax=Artomyces pyxidatus TaxID=48021 RepID=A0ACB8TB21_9AGAM|nr:hypothetical protein BV25DRAFT_1836610 [Artomyces pyxidatus]